MRVFRQPAGDPLFERLQGDEDDAGVRRVGEGGAVEADELDGMRDARTLHDDFRSPAHDLVGTP